MSAEFKFDLASFSFNDFLALVLALFSVGLSVASCFRVTLKEIVVKEKLLAATLLHLVAASASAAPPERAFPANSPIKASVSLLPLSGSVGRETAFYSNYRPQLRGANDTSGVTCAIDLGSPEAKVEPGETASAVLRCLDPLVVSRLPATFHMVEGGRKVGVATIPAQP